MYRQRECYAVWILLLTRCLVVTVLVIVVVGDDSGCGIGTAAGGVLYSIYTASDGDDSYRCYLRHHGGVAIAVMLFRATVVIITNDYVNARAADVRPQ